MESECEARLKCPLVGWFGYFALWVTPVGSRVVFCMRLLRSSVKLVNELWAWFWWWSQSYLSEEMRVGEVAAPDGR